MANFYAAYEIDDASRQALLEVFKPKYPDVVAHHITYKYGATPEDVPKPPESVRIVGYHDSGAIQVLVVDVDGNGRQAKRDDGKEKFLHITLALDRVQGVSPSKSNDVLQRIVAEKGPEALYNLAAPVEIKVTPKLILDPPTFAEAEAEAEQILSHKTQGPNGVIAYAVVNDQKIRADGVAEPFFNPASDNPLHLAYAFFETNRVGVPVISAPGGTQDIFAVNPVTGASMTVELTKESCLKEALATIGEPQPSHKSVDALEKYTVAKLIEKGWRVEIEDSYSAAVREAKEEQGIDLTSSGSYIGAPQQFDRPAITKRTIDRLESIHRAALFDIRSANDLNDVKQIALHLRDCAPPGVSPDAPQRLFAIQVPGFDGVAPVDSDDLVENKIKGREGSLYSEKGTFVTLAQMEERLAAALPLAKQEQERGNSHAGREIIATYERLHIFQRIEGALVKQLQAQGLNVTTGVAPEQADTPDSVDNAHQGTASLPAALAKTRPARAAKGLNR